MLMRCDEGNGLSFASLSGLLASAVKTAEALHSSPVAELSCRMCWPAHHMRTQGAACHAHLSLEQKPVIVSRSISTEGWLSCSLTGMYT